MHTDALTKRPTLYENDALANDVVSVFICSSGDWLRIE